MKRSYLNTARGVITVPLLSIPFIGHAEISEIIVPNGSFEIMMTENASNEFVIPYLLDDRGITNVPIGGDDWGPNNQQVDTLGWYSYEDGRGDVPLYVFSPMHFTANTFTSFDEAVNGRVIVAVNPHDDSFGAADLGVMGTEGVYTLQWGSGWSMEKATEAAIPNVDVILQYKVDETTWADLADVSTTMSNKADIQAAMSPGQFRNDIYTAYTIESGSAAIGAELRVVVPCSTAESGGTMDNVRLYFSAEGDIAMDLDVANHSLELMYAVPAGTPLPNVDRGDEPFTEADYTSPYLLTQNGVTRVPFGGDDWGPNNQQVWTVGWDGTQANYDFSPMSFFALESTMTSGFDLTTVGFVAQAVNPNASEMDLGWTDVRAHVVEGMYSVIWGSGRNGSDPYREVFADLHYSLDGGATWSPLADDADAVTTNQATLAASIAEGEFLPNFQTNYTIGPENPALGAMLRVVVSTTATSDGGVGDRYRVAYVGSGVPSTRGPGVYSGYLMAPDGWINSDIGWIQAGSYPWVYALAIDQWLYIAEGSFGPNGGWIFHAE